MSHSLAGQGSRSLCPKGQGLDTLSFWCGQLLSNYLLKYFFLIFLKFKTEYFYFVLSQKQTMFWLIKKINLKKLIFILAVSHGLSPE